MDKKITLMLMVIFLLAIVACGTDSNKRPITEVDIRKGTDGLIMEFLPNAPPINVFAESGFPISLKLENAGAFDIVENNKETSQIEGGIVVFGFEKAYIGLVSKIKEEVMKVSDEEKKILPGNGINIDEIKTLSNKNQEDLTNEERDKIQKFVDTLTNFRAKKEFNIKGKSIYSPLGDEEFINVNARARTIGPQSETHPSAIFATACYPYETVFGDSVCIDTDIIGESKGKVCTAKDLTFTKGQGAPVAVTKVETRMLPQDDGKIKPHFLIHVKNAGNGEVIDPGKIEVACKSEALDYRDFNTIIVSASLSGTQLRCSKDAGAVPGPVTIRLREKEDLIRCTYDGKDDDKGGIDAGLDAYVAPLKVELDYGYTFTISKNIIIEKVLTH